jgi:NAD(P)-dependent dehydrogenase (short-subunit alcohol dehydrogenase family)
MTSPAGTYRNLFDLTDRVAVVTGAAGILGQVFCAALADHGALVAAVDVDESGAMALAEELSARHRTTVIGIGCDVADPASVSAMADEVEQRLGVPHVLHNNAATKTSDLEAFFAPVEELTLETWREAMSVNLDGMFLVAQRIGARMAAQGRGSIVQTASIYGMAGPDQRIYDGSWYLGQRISTPAMYSASKAGVVGLTRHLATHWAGSGLRVNALVPGGVASGQNDEFARRYSERVPMGRMADADELAGALVFLASDASAYVTGETLAVDGGLLAW